MQKINCIKMQIFTMIYIEFKYKKDYVIHRIYYYTYIISLKKIFNLYVTYIFSYSISGNILFAKYMNSLKLDTSSGLTLSDLSKDKLTYLLKLFGIKESFIVENFP